MPFYITRRVKTICVALTGMLCPLLTRAQDSTRQLKAVEITSKKPLIERKPDRTIFNVENSIATAGADAFETLKKHRG
ncbi:hypothetical protein MKQ70_17035 [Chitinophaga sedimenti]|uniref:hypothetical protein n=1 Tax=Chitinophaga sedimenti TaxID=2033606 RepID=UPI002005FE40|nr:hypothetical protein [Chitinophaga sedimenti]MCK7556631.1 hypothetical protein [Chitinophaga sedimenti]